MYLKNLKEDLVIKVIQDVLQDLPEVCQCLICIEDISTYVLNRLKPYYISSGRGILHLEKDLEPYLQDQADIYTLVLQAIKIIQKRRRDQRHTYAQNGLKFLNQEEIEVVNDYYLNFPYIVGRVLDGLTLKPKGNVRVDLFVYQNGQYQLAKMKDPSWINPYVVPPQVTGYFTFWPAPILAEKQKDHQKETVHLKLCFDEGEHQEEFSLSILSDQLIRHHINTKFVYETNPVLM